MPEFKHLDLKLIVPSFDSSLTDRIIELDYLRRKLLTGSTPPSIFFQLKSIFHMLESVASARIEGNVTTVADYIETKIKQPMDGASAFREIQNMEKCLEFIDSNINNTEIDRAFISELHKKVVQGLPFQELGEGDATPGLYRRIQVKIKGSTHVTPEPTAVTSYMDELFQFIANQHQQKFDLLKTAVVHHRFAWIHPFTNGNGRTVRMLTYAMLIKYGFNVGTGRILNPAAVFCSNRNDYYNNLSLADEGTDENLLIWCEYVLNGLKNEIEKIDRLLEYDFLKKNILIPAIDDALDQKWITDREYKVLKLAIQKKVLKASDLVDVIPFKHSSERSRIIYRLREKKMLIPIRENARKYTICFQNNYLIRSVIRKLYDEKFVI